MPNFNKNNQPIKQAFLLDRWLYLRFYFLLPISRESIVLGSNFQNGDFDEFTHVLRSPESENCIFSVWSVSKTCKLQNME